MKTLLAAALLIAAVSVTGCATTSESGHTFDQSKTDQLIKGKSTKTDALGLLGPANGSQSLPTGASQLVYTHTTVSTSLFPLTGAGGYSWEECRVNFDPRGFYSGTECNSTASAPTR